MQKNIYKKIITIVITILFLFTNTFIVFGSCDLKTEILYKKIDFDDEKIFDLKIKMLMFIGRIPSLSVGIIENDSIIHYKGYGHYNNHYLFFNRKEPNKDTIYNCGSISKSISATALMILYEQEKFDLDDNVNDYLDFEVKNPYYPDDNITFRMLLSHHSSLNSNQKNEIIYLVLISIFNKEIYPYPLIKNLLESNKSILLNPIWADIKPGSEFLYSNIGFILIEHLIEKISEQSFNDFCKINIFDKLNMFNTSFTIKDLNKNQIAVPSGEIFGIYFRFPKINGAAAPGGLRSSVNDLSNYLILHMNNGTFEGKQILSEENITLMHTIQYPGTYPPDSDSKYGLGWQIWVNEGIMGHIGEVPGGFALMMMNKTYKKGIVLFTNRMLYNNNRNISQKFFNNIIDLIIERYSVF